LIEKLQRNATPTYHTIVAQMTKNYKK